MPTTGPSIEARGAERTAKHLSDMGRRARNVKPAGYKARTIFHKAEEARFSTTGGGTWKALASSTQERKAREGLDPRTNRATNALHRSLTSATAGDQVDERQAEWFRFGTTVPYAPHVDRARKLIDLTPTQRRAIDKAIEDYVARGQAAAPTF
jgi:hypothetical protein